MGCLPWPCQLFKERFAGPFGQPHHRFSDPTASTSLNKVLPSEERKQSIYGGSEVSPHARSSPGIRPGTQTDFSKQKRFVESVMGRPVKYAWFFQQVTITKSMRFPLTTRLCLTLKSKVSKVVRKNKTLRVKMIVNHTLSKLLLQKISYQRP